MPGIPRSADPSHLALDYPSTLGRQMSHAHALYADHKPRRAESTHKDLLSHKSILTHTSE
jgi:hypothetical protein